MSITTAYRHTHEATSDAGRRAAVALQDWTHRLTEDDRGMTTAEYAVAQTSNGDLVASTLWSCGQAAERRRHTWEPSTRPVKGPDYMSSPLRRG